MAFTYVTKRAQQIANCGVGNPDWDKPMSNRDYGEQGNCAASDIAIENVVFRDSVGEQLRKGIGDDDLPGN